MPAPGLRREAWSPHLYRMISIDLPLSDGRQLMDPFQCKMHAQSLMSLVMLKDQSRRMASQRHAWSKGFIFRCVHYCELMQMIKPVPGTVCR